MQSTNIAIVLLPNFNAMATMALLDPFRAANYLHGADGRTGHLYRWQFVTIDTRLEASNGLPVQAKWIGELGNDRFDYIFVSSSWTPEQYQDRTLFAWLRRQASQRASLGGLDTGAFILGFAGLLDGYTATVHYEHLAAFEELFANIEVSDALYVIDRNRLTCCGGIAASDLALDLVRQHHGDDLANASSRYIFHDRFRPAGEKQMPMRYEPLGRSAPKAIHTAVAIMHDALERPKPVAAISAEVGLSQRQLERLFHKHTGVSPVRYYADMRLDRARGMVTQTELSVIEISVACGFSSPEYMTKCYRERFGITPREDRVVGRIPFQFRSFPTFADRSLKRSGESI